MSFLVLSHLNVEGKRNKEKLIYETIISAQCFQMKFIKNSKNKTNLKEEFTETDGRQCHKTKVCAIDDTPIFPQRKYDGSDANVCCQNQKNYCNWHLWIVVCLIVVVDFILLLIIDNVCIELARFERILGLLYQWHTWRCPMMAPVQEKKLNLFLESFRKDVFGLDWFEQVNGWLQHTPTKKKIKSKWFSALFDNE